MTNQHVLELIKEYDAGRRDSDIYLKVYYALTYFVARGMSSEAEDLKDGEFEDEEALKNGVEWLRRKQNANHLNA